VSHCFDLERLAPLGRTSIQCLTLHSCISLTRMPESLPALSELRIHFANFDLNLFEVLPPSYPSLRHLSIMNCWLMEQLPDLLGQLGALRELTIDACALSVLPETVGHLGSLQTLNLTCCKSLTALPDSLGRLDSLRVLDLGRCTSLARLPDSLGQASSLCVLRIEFTHMTRLPDSLCRLARLETLVARHCTHLTVLPASLGQLGSLRQLNLENVWRLTSLPDSVSRLASLRTLNLSRCISLRRLPVSMAMLPDGINVNMMGAGVDFPNPDDFAAVRASLLQHHPLPRILILVLHARRHCLRTLPPELWCLLHDEFF
jgi:hypothetical protein